MLRLNSDRSYTLMQPTSPSSHLKDSKSLPTPKIHKDQHKKLIEFEVWKDINKQALKHIMYYLYDFIMNLNTGDYTLTINPDIFEQLMLQKIYECSENRFENFNFVERERRNMVLDNKKVDKISCHE